MNKGMRVAIVLLSGWCALGNLAGPACAEPSEEAVMVEDMLAAYAARHDFPRAYCLLYARLEAHPGDVWTEARLRELQTAVRFARDLGNDAKATLGFYHFTAGRRVQARREWTGALRARRLAAPVRERILKCLQMPEGAPATVTVALAAVFEERPY